jgi:tryptophan synthase beta chain
MHSLGHNFIPAPIHAGGLRYHGMSPAVSQLVVEGIVNPKAVTQLAAYDAGLLFARTEGHIPAPETSHAIAAVVEEAKKAGEEGREKVILFNFSGHGLLDLGAYEKYLEGGMKDLVLSDEEMEKARQVFEKYPKPQILKSR